MNNLSREIAKRIVSNLGFLPNSKGNIGLFSSDLKINKQVSLKEENNINKFDVFSGTIADLDKPVTAVNFGDVIEPEIIVSFWNEHALKLDWSDPEDFGIFLTRRNDSWHPMNLIGKINLLLLLEHITDEGLLWNKHNMEVYDDFISVIDHIDIL